VEPKAPVTADLELEARPELVNPALEGLAQLDEAEFEQQFNRLAGAQQGFWLAAECGYCHGNSGQGRLRPGWRDGPRPRTRACARRGPMAIGRSILEETPTRQVRMKRA